MFYLQNVDISPINNIQKRTEIGIFVVLKKLRKCQKN